MQKSSLERLLLPRPQKLANLISSRQGRLKKFFEPYIQADRLITHLVILGLILGVATIGGLQFPQQQLTVSQSVFPKLPLEVDVKPDNGQPLTLSGILENKTDIIRPAVVLRTTTTTSDRTVTVEEIRTYQVQPGDTVYGIALKFDLAPETILWANRSLEDNPDFLQLGQELIILPVDGVYHQVDDGDTIAGLATTYKVEPETIINYHLNVLDPENPVIIPDQWLIVPAGVKPYTPKYVSAITANAPEDALSGTGTFHWPTTGTISQDFWSGHRALDIAAWEGAPIYAADAGYVVAAQWDDTGYGLTVTVDHGNSFKTLYAHTNKIFIAVGDEVSQGQQIGEVGSTGNSTGPHLHFEIISNGVKRNPWGYLH